MPTEQNKMKRHLMVATKAAKKAGSYLLQQYHSPNRIAFSRKTKKEFVTKHDLASEQIITTLLKKNFSYSIIAEESGTRTKPSEYTWIIDPIDGTTNFIHKFPFFCISIGLAKNGQSVMGVVYNPVYNELFYAMKGKGAFLNSKRIKVSSTTKLQQAIIATGFGYASGKVLDRQLKLFNKVRQRLDDARRNGAAALDLCYTAMGRMDGYYEAGIKIWDIAAGKVILEEAGGRATTMDGKKITNKVTTICGTNGKLHPKLLPMLK